jgi:hypothetical protein
MPTPQAIWPIAKFLIKVKGTKTPSGIHGLLGLKHHPRRKTFLANEFKSHDLLGGYHEMRVDALD